MGRNRGRDQRLLIGVTGGIASGKTTVANMFHELGMATIDFDVLARKVVEPGAPGLAKIVDYFGEQVLAPGGVLDRKKLSRIVFGDAGKRKMLESFTHPYIFEEFHRQADDIARENPKALIQVVVPLLVELGLQNLFDRILVVHVSAEEQIRRLAARDGISREEAANILKAQLPIDEKLKFADWVVDNSGDLKATRSRVERVWLEMQALSREAPSQRDE